MEKVGCIQEIFKRLNQQHELHKKNEGERDVHDNICDYVKFWEMKVSFAGIQKAWRRAYFRGGMRMEIMSSHSDMVSVGFLEYPTRDIDS